MNLLLDHCVPRPFVRLLFGHAVRTAREMGWSDLANGQLLAQAATQFDVFVTVDRNLPRQQHHATLPLPVVVLHVADNTVDSLVPLVPELLKVLERHLMPRVYEVPEPPVNRT